MQVTWGRVAGSGGLFGAGVDTPVISALILLASVVNGVDWLSTGLTLEKMGLKDVTKFTLHRFLAEGRL